TIIAAPRYRAQFKVSEGIFAFASDAPFSSLAWLAFSGRFLRVGKRNCRRRMLAFPANCASCHGLDGRGTERAPSIAGSGKVQRMSDEQVFRVISDGVPDTGMPAFHSLSAIERRRIVRHLRMLQGRTKAGPVAAGNAEQGKAIFFGKAECSNCHMIEGRGGFLGSDLTAYARTKSAQEIRQAIVNPGADPDPRTKAITATTHDGRMVSGILRNHDNFSVQIQ